MDNQNLNTSIIDFLKSKSTGKIHYVEKEAVQTTSEKPDRLEEISFVMEMSTDELISEMGCRLEYGKSLRDVSDSVLIDELCQRLTAMKFLLAAYTHIKSTGEPCNES
jgi:hypothetical protein